jgi:hypothetical protein
MYIGLEIVLDCVIPFLDALVIRKGMVLASKFIDNSPTVANTSSSNLIILSMSEEEQFRV